MKPTMLSTTTRSAGIAASLLLAALTAASGVAYRVSDRELSAADRDQMVARLRSFSDQIGDWRLRAAPELSEGVVRELHCYGYVNGEYSQRGTPRQAHLLLMLGPAGTMATHTPEVCYGSRDFEILGAPSRVDCRDSANRTHQFWLTRVGRRDASAQVLRVYHAWSDNGVWQASEHPRWDFTFAPILGKCQVAFLESELPHASAEEVKFLSELTTITSTKCKWPEPSS